VDIKPVLARIKLLKGLKNDSEIAALLGIGANDFSNRKKRGTLLQPIVEWAAHESVSFDDLLCGEGQSRGLGYDREKFSEIGVFALAGAGPARDLVEHEPIDTLIVPRSFWKPSIVAIRVKGRSMEPVILDGAIVGVDRDDRDIVSGYIYAVWIPYEGAVIKRVHMRPEQIIFRSDNPEHDDFSLPLSEGIPDMILGRVKWVWQGLEKQD
jgi:SOS-response transcriptional repressor LexA